MPSINYQHFANEIKELNEDNRILERENEEMRNAIKDILRELDDADDHLAIVIVSRYWKWFQRTVAEW